MFDRYRGRGDDDYGPPPPPFRLRRTTFNFGNFRGVNKWIILGVTLVIAFVVLDTMKGIYINLLWFDGAGYEEVYTKVIRTQVALFAAGGLIMALFLGINVWWAARLALLTPARGIVDDAEATSLRRLFTVGLIAGVLFVAAIFGTIAASNWELVLPYFNATSFGVNDPQFGKDVGFYVFELPALRLLFGWAFSAVVVTILAVSGLYLFRYLVVGADVETGRHSRPHLCVLLLFAVGLFIFHYYLTRYELVFSTKGVVFGATYTDVHARLLFIYVGIALALLTAGALVFAAVTRRTSAPITTMILWAVVMVVGATAYPETVQRIQVQPNELEKEREYIQRNIDMTRRAFGLDAIEEKQFPAAPEVTAQEIADNQGTIDNIRLLDVVPLRQTYAQIQTIRPLYEFLDVDVDRYTIDGQRRSVMLSARELSSSRLPQDAQGWVNRRLQFTHGYGAVMSPVNSVVQEGLPDLWLRDIPISGKLQITRPEIYYGEEPEHYVIVNTRAKEFDYPVGDGSVQTVFEGKGRNVTILVQPDGALEARTLRFPLWVLRAGLGAAIALATLLVFMAVTYGPTVRAALRVPLLERQVERLEVDNARIRELAAALDSLERRYNQVRGMLGGDLVPNLAKMGSNLPLAPTINAVSPGERTFPEGPTAPSFWPLDDPSYVTRGRSQDDPDGPHEGVDIAVAVGSVVRAAGGGTVSEAGDDPQFGLFVIVQHPGEYQTLYGHLSRIVVTKEQTVAPGEVIGLAGNTGRSSAPHLHLEVRFQGKTVDPLTLVKQEG